LRIGRASGSLIETSRSVIFSPRARRLICSETFSQRSASCSSIAAARSLAFAPRPRAVCLARTASLRASRADRAICAPALEFSSITCALASPVRRASVLEICRTVRPTDRDRSRTLPALPLIIPASFAPSRASARVPCSASTASDGYLMSASMTVESTLTARPTNRVSRWALAITNRVISLTVSAPSRRVSLRTVDSSGTRRSMPIRQNLRRCNESETSRTSVS
jgi:hypothetical protein